MKIQKTLIALVLLSLHTVAFAHCPASFKPEKVCLMLDKNMLFIYDHKLEHNGPYKDMEKADVSAFKNAKGENLPFKKVARGIFKVESTEDLKSLVVVIAADKKKTDIQVTHE